MPGRGQAPRSRMLRDTRAAVRRRRQCLCRRRIHDEAVAKLKIEARQVTKSVTPRVRRTRDADVQPADQPALIEPVLHAVRSKHRRVVAAIASCRAARTWKGRAASRMRGTAVRMTRFVHQIVERRCNPGPLSLVLALIVRLQGLHDIPASAERLTALELSRLRFEVDAADNRCEPAIEALRCP